MAGNEDIHGDRGCAVNMITNDLYPCYETWPLNACDYMDNLEHLSAFDNTGHLKPSMLNVGFEHEEMSSSMYGTNLCPTVPQYMSATTLPDTSSYQSGRSHHDHVNICSDFRPFPALYNNITSLHDNSVQSYLNPPHVSIYSYDYCQPTYRPYDEAVDRGSLSTLPNDAVFHPQSNVQGKSNVNITGIPVSMLDNKSKRPCNCTKSRCLKLYCDCFANGEFCNNCNCINCYNNVYHEPERDKAIKTCLDKNPEAFQPKIGKVTTGDSKPRHTKGCNCKRSGCLKNYCACYEAKIMCSSICKCSGCKNYEGSLGQGADVESILRACSSMDVVRATCSCLLARAEEAEKEEYSARLAEQAVLEEFGKCISQMLNKDFQGNISS